MFLQALIYGFLIFQLFFITIQYYFFRRKEFIYYFYYVLMFIVFVYAYYEPDLGLTQFFKNNVENIKSFTRIEGLLIFSSYVVFARYFTDAKINFPQSYTYMRILERFLLAGFFIQILFLFISKNGDYREYLSWVFFIPGFSFAIFIGLKLILLKDKLTNFIIIGSLFAIAGSFIQAIIDCYNYLFVGNFHTSSLIMETGIIIEFLFLNIGFMYKNKILQLKQDEIKDAMISANTAKNELRQQLFDVRTMLAMDLHDDISSSIGSMRIVSGLMESDLNIENQKKYSAKMIRSVNELSEQVGVLVWSFNEKNDTLRNFVEYTNAYLQDYLNAKAIQLKLETSLYNPAQIINGNVRKNLFLCIKEAIYNSLKYANVNTIYLQINSNSDGLLTIIIKDMGKGFDVEKARGNGLQNIRKRMQLIKGTADIKANKGTIITLTYSFE